VTSFASKARVFLLIVGGFLAISGLAAWLSRQQAL
jgi:hypothetical protein